MIFGNDTIQVEFRTMNTYLFTPLETIHLRKMDGVKVWEGKLHNNVSARVEQMDDGFGIIVVIERQDVVDEIFHLHPVPLNYTSLHDLYQSLCTRDPRNPHYYDIYGWDDEDDEWPVPRKDCACDPCHRGTDPLALKVLELLGKLNER